MKTLLIPIDLTATNDNAVAFAAEWCKKYEYTRIILLKTFYDVFDKVVMAAGYVSPDYMQDDRNAAMNKIEEMVLNLTADTGANVVVIVSEEPLLRAIMEAIDEEKPDMLLVGSDNEDHSSDSFIAGNVIHIAKISPVRVMIVPAGYRYKPVEIALLPTNFSTLETLDKLNSLKTSPLWAGTKVQVLYVDDKERYLTPDEAFKNNEERLKEYLKHFEYEVQYSNDSNIINGILSFVQTHAVQLIIAMPGKHSFLYALTHKSISEAIYRNAKEPVLILK